ncbi:MAG: SDR family oxidoreductase [Salinivirgaceae bacterium]|jgi:NAD(P)-dependent dehydrogenase (short-subunit alcohol dehydrogenase family)|nr:SDR family oxidoreductase [Salinivirgaceae bacterium]MBR4274123.1 SDR family oxidoreductase [Bacteroidales bacterium]
MIFDRNNNKPVVALLGAGSMGTAIVRRIAAGKKIILGDISENNLKRVSDDLLRSGYDVETIIVNALEKQSVEAFAKRAAELGPVMYFIDTAGASPNQANPQHIVDLDMVGTGYAVDAFGEVMAQGGAGLIISSQAAYMYPIPNDVEVQLVRTPTDQLKNVPFINEVALQNSGFAYMIAKRLNHLQAQRAAATTWRKRGARINTISPGIIVTPLAYDEFNANGDGYQRMIDASAAQRVGTSDEIAEVAAFLLGEHAKFITGTDLLIDGGVIASIRAGEYQLG